MIVTDITLTFYVGGEVET